MDDGPYRFEGTFECPVCEESIETVDDVYDHLGLHDLDLEEMLPEGTR